MIQPIETNWRGYRFRSRLEARWAVFFDRLGVEWVYEPQGFQLSTGERYLPDFYLPRLDGGIYVEVKHEGGDTSKAERFAKEMNCKLLLACGVPDTRSFDAIYPEAGPAGWTEVAFRDKYLPGGRNADEHRLYVGSAGGRYDDELHVLAAVRAARGARFEHGESPK